MQGRMTTSRIQHNFHSDCVAALNQLANLELHASYVYLAMSFHFDRDDVAMCGFQKLFHRHSQKEYNNVEEIFSHQCVRGGRIVLKDISKPPVSHWNTGLEALMEALELEKNVNQAALSLHELAGQHGDKETCDWLEGKFLQDKVETIKMLGEHITNLRKVGPGQGEYLFEKETLK